MLINQRHHKIHIAFDFASALGGLADKPRHIGIEVKSAFRLMAAQTVNLAEFA
ncbi:hypothetical protein D3C77_783680 [compost metagenome]